MTMTSAADLGSNRHLLCSQRLRERRRDLGLTQKQVITRLARLGVASTNKALSSLEHGSGLDIAKLPELAVALECSVTWLIGLTDEPRSWEPTGAYAPRRRGAEAAAQPVGRPLRRRVWLVRPVRGVGTPPHPRPHVRRRLRWPPSRTRPLLPEPA